MTIDPGGEDWRPIPGYVGLYEASSLGRIRSVDREVRYDSGRVLRWSGRILAQSCRPDRRVQVTLTHPKSGHRKSKVHSVIAMTFIGPRPEGMVIRHVDGNPKNNAVDNLAYGTIPENSIDSVRHGTHPQARKVLCPQGHALVDPNLRPALKRNGHRGCLACSRTYGLVRKNPSLTDQFAAIADRKYLEIMNGAKK